MARLLTTINVDLVGATRSIGTARALLSEHHPDLLVLDVDLPNARAQALGLIERVRGEEPQLTVVVLSGTDECLLIESAFDRGARAYVLKSSEPEDIVTAISQAFEQSLYLTKPGSEPTMPAHDDVLLRKLTRRELEILRLVAGGRSNHEVAKMLFVADETVKFHLANVYRKLGVHSRYEAARWARAQGLLDLIQASNVVSLPDASAAETLRRKRRPRPAAPARRRGRRRAAAVRLT